MICITKYEVEMDEGMLEKVQSGFPDLKLVKVEETAAGDAVKPPEEKKEEGK